MTEKELKQLYWISKEIQILKKQLEELLSESYIKCQNLNVMPFSGGTTNSTEEKAIAIQEIREQIELKLKDLYFTRTKIERFIEKIEDGETRLIIRLRCINNMSWEQIGDEIGMDRRTVSRKYYKFIKVAHNAHSICVKVIA